MTSIARIEYGNKLPQAICGEFLAFSGVQATGRQAAKLFQSAMSAVGGE